MAPKKKITKKKVSKTPNRKQTLADIEKKLWQAADKLRANMDAAEYKHVVLGLVFLKYVSDSFDEFREQLKKELIDPKHDNYFEGASEKDIEKELEDRDHYISNNIFWVPKKARWHRNTVAGAQGIQDKAKQSDIGKIIDDAMVSIEKDNPKLKGVLPKDFARRQPNIRLGELVDLISTIGFKDSEHQAKDILGHVYEYFLGQFASAEGKRGGGYRLDGLKEYTGKYKLEQVVKNGDLVFAFTDITQAADLIGKPAIVIADPKYNTLIASLDVAIFHPKKEVYKQLIYGHGMTYIFQEYTKAYSTGTTVLHLSKDAIPNYKLCLPCDELMLIFSKIANHHQIMIQNNIEESNNLVKLRDTLLPKLLAGKIDLSNIKICGGS